MNSEHTSPSKAMQYLEQAYASEERKEYQQALEECDTAIHLDPGLAEAHNLRGMILDALGRKEEAAAGYREALRLDPAFREARENLQDIEHELKERGSRSPSTAVEVVPIGGTPELADYVLKGDGLGRVGLNIICFIGVFIFGWLLAVAFQMLGKKNLGWVYVVPIFICVGASRVIEPALGLLALPIYAAGWVHANIILSHLQSGARHRIAEIDRLPESQGMVNTMLEKGILQGKVLADHEAALTTLAQALQLPGGNAQLLNQAGVVLFADKRYEEAKTFFSRALSAATDEPFIKLVKRNQANAEKKIK